NSIRVSRSKRDVAYKAMQTKERLTGENLKEPTVEEIAQDMGMRKQDVVLALESIVEPVSLYEPVYSDSGDTIFVMDQLGDKNDDSNWLEELSIREAISNLTPREKKILSLRFFTGKTQMEVAGEIGISQAQVRWKGALAKRGSLKRRLEGCFADKRGIYPASFSRYHVVSRGSASSSFSNLRNSCGKDPPPFRLQ
ncbi:MAG: sigma factor-like helix-turn-helix DNA-binding protein, partial [[Clostridium] leptum]